MRLSYCIKRLLDLTWLVFGSFHWKYIWGMNNRGKNRRSHYRILPPTNSILVFAHKRLCKVSSKSTQNCNCRSDDRHTDRQTDRRKWFYNLSHAIAMGQINMNSLNMNLWQLHMMQYLQFTIQYLQNRSWKRCCARCLYVFVVKLWHITSCTK